ncbi:MAG: hypothetical protein ACQCN3_00520 [Candidatus Bathyarchaeia archaeon]|jgi:Fe2+ or Zn2+ uptake regulation protein
MRLNNHENGTLEDLFGSSATARILDFMAVSKDYDYNKQDIAENSEVSLRHAYTAIDKLEKLELIKKTRHVGLSQMYKFNIENQAAKILADFAHTLAAQECTKIANKEKPQTVIISKEESTHLTPKQLI